MSGQTELRALFAYDPDTGLFAHRLTNRRVEPGMSAGSLQKRQHTNYLILTVGRKKVRAHRAAWIYVHGEIADDLVIDHIDGNGLNNRLANLRAVTKSINQRNRRDVRAGLCGVYRHRGGFTVQAAGDYIGWTKDFFEACCLRKSAEARLGYIVGAT